MKHSFAFFVAAVVAGLFVFPSTAFAQAAPRPQCEMRASATSVTLGDTVLLQWRSVFASSTTITTLGSVGTTGAQGVIPTGNGITYIGTFTGPGGITQCGVRVTVVGGAGVTQPIGAVPPNSTLDGTVAVPPFPGSPGIPTGSPGSPVGAPSAVPTGGAPSAATTPTSQLVPCVGLNCQLCHVAELGQRGINFLLVLTVPIGGILIALAGVMYFTSAENPGQRSRAKNFLKKAIIGMIIAFSGWLVVNTFLTLLFSSSVYSGISSGWFRISCVDEDERPRSTNVGTWVNSILGIPQAPPVAITSTAAHMYTCPAGFDRQYDYNEGYTCYNPTTGSTTAATPISLASTGGSTGAGVAQWRTQMYQACMQVGLSNCEFALAIMANESGGNCGLTGPTQDYGCMQVTCGAAQSHDPTGWAQGRSCTEISQRLLTDYQYNMLVGVNEAARCYNQFGGATADAIACYNGGAGAIRPSTTCPGQTVWACEANSGYAVTRLYVPRVLSTLQRFVSQFPQ